MQKQKEISTLTGTLIIVVASIVIFGGVLIFQYYSGQKILALFTSSYSLAALIRK